MTTYRITHEQISPTADEVTEQGLRDYLADMARDPQTGDQWAGLADTVTAHDDGLHVTLNGQPTLVAEPAS